MAKVPKTHFSKPSSVCELKTALQAGHFKSRSAYNHSNAMFFTKYDKMPGNLLKARSDRNFCCCYSLHSSASEIIDFPSSLQFESITPFVCPDQDTPLDSVNAFIIKKLKHRNPNPSNDATTKLWKKRINFNERGKRKFYLKKISTNTPEYEYHREPLRQ